jgi:hypothetical protein
MGGEQAEVYAQSAMLWGKHALALAGDLVAYAFVNRAWWLLPTVFVLLLVVSVIAVGQAVSTYTLYTVF